jgi:hypothetical protein
LPILLFKLLVTPLFIMAVTLAARRWGPAAGGMLMGLPLTSGPISVFLALQYGPAFAAHAAVGNLVGQGSVCLFCLTYARASRRWSWPRCVVLALGAFLAATWLLKRWPWHLGTAFLFLLAAVLLVGRWIPAPQPLPAGPRPPAWDLPARMALATLFVLLLTASAGSLGPQLSGLLAPFPVFGVVLAAFTQAGQGGAAASRLLRGNVVGAAAFAAFFGIVGLGLGRWALAPVYLGAALASVATSAALFLAQSRHQAA